jgi:2,3-bisphosphoglycerate-independent phosphoglycerate mutase
VVALLVILDGASEPLGPAATSLERARTPVLDRLARAGTLTRLTTVGPGLAPGSEVAIPALLGWTPPAGVDRALLEAAARGIDVAAGQRAWRVDVRCGDRRAGEDAARQMATTLRAAVPDHVVHPLGGHRLLVCGPGPLPAAVAGRPGLRVWADGVAPPRILGAETVLVAAPGAAAGAARLMGATVVTPPGATGLPHTDLRAKARAALAAMGHAQRVVVHVGGPDEAAHERDAAGKVSALERIDAELLAPLAAAAQATGAILTVCPDHGCDPATGEHDGAPVPCLTWPGRARSAGARLTERDVAHLPAGALTAHREAA